VVFETHRNVSPIITPLSWVNLGATLGEPWDNYVSKELQISKKSMLPF